VLRHENQVLRRQLTGRLRWDHADRLWLAALSRLVSRRRWPEVFPVTPAITWPPPTAGPPTSPRVHRTLISLPEDDQRRLGVTATG